LEDVERISEECELINESDIEKHEIKEVLQACHLVYFNLRKIYKGFVSFAKDSPVMQKYKLTET